MLDAAVFEVRLTDDRSEGEAARSTVRVGQRLAITGFVLVNPGGDAGELRLRAAGTEVAVQPLESFRHIDEHFVTPLIVDGQKDITVEIHCQNEGRCCARPV